MFGSSARRGHPALRSRTVSTMSQLNARISSHIDAFLRDIDGLLRSVAITRARESLANIGASTGRTHTASKSAASHRASAPTAPHAPAGGNSAAAKFLAYVRAHPGVRTHVACKALGIHTDDFRYTLNRMLKAGVLTKRGVRRGTKYYAGTTGG